MKVSEQQKREIEKLITLMKCDKDFQCCRTGFTNLCKARYIGMDSRTECLEENPQKCGFSLALGYKSFCQCSLRVYIAKNLESHHGDTAYINASYALPMQH